MKIIRCPDCNSSRIQYLAFNKNLAYLQSELTKEWYTPNITTQDIQAENPNPMFRCVKCDKEIGYPSQQEVDAWAKG
jgi:DNA-directed RNA polymerase subunit RPC12/RpoP